jgi:hypothetical protein
MRSRELLLSARCEFACGNRREILRSTFKGTAGGGARTHTALRPLDFESSASANSATPAITYLRWFYNENWCRQKNTVDAILTV